MLFFVYRGYYMLLNRFKRNRGAIPAFIIFTIVDYDFIIFWLFELKTDEHIVKISEQLVNN